MLAPAARGALLRLGFINPQWPDWAVDTFIWLSVGCVALVGAQWLYDRRLSSGVSKGGDASSLSASGEAMTAKFRRFQFKYLVVYLTVMLADWLQGTNMYTLYQSYDMDVGTLFLTGFSSSAIFGTFLGLFVDRFGRRNGCIVFCLLEVVINALEHIPNMMLLLLGRILGGISTSLLFSAFESWMVSEHRKQGFPEDWLASTFSAATVGNGIMAVLAGVVAQIAADKLGHIGPFQVAIALTLMSLSLLLLWEENYGYGHGRKSNGNTKSSNGSKTSNSNGHEGENTVKSSHTNGDNGDTGHAKEEDVTEEMGFRQSVSMAWGCIMSDNRVLLLGLVQSLFEGGTFTFVFMWVPTLQGVAPNGDLPTGLVFSSFMVCITIGGVLFSIMIKQMSVELASSAVFLTAAASMALPAFTRDFSTVFAAFLVLETCVGAFYSCSGLMRSRYLPGGLQSSVMNIFRLPLNIIVVVGTRITDLAKAETVFIVIASWFLTSALLQRKLSASVSTRENGDKGAQAGLPGEGGAAAVNGKGVKAD